MKIKFTIIILLAAVSVFAQKRIEYKHLSESRFSTKSEQSSAQNKVDDYPGVWTKVNPSIPAEDYLGIHFVNPDTGWAVGSNGSIAYSINGGVKWNTATSPTTDVLINVHSYNGRTVVASGNNGTIVRSTDYGINWQTVPSGVGGNLWEIKMINDTLGWTCGTGPSLLRTTNGGESWTIVNTGYTSFNYWALDFLNKDSLFIGCSFGNILKTTDGGESWQLLQTGFGKGLYRIKAFSEDKLLAGGEMGWVARTFDGGMTWYYSTAGGEIDAMAFADDSVGYISGYLNSDAIYKTTDGGISWQYQAQSDVGEYWIMFVNDTLGYNSGLDLVIKKTTNKGQSWRQQIIKDNFKDVWAIDENTAYAVGGTIYKTTNGGDTWQGIFPYDPANAGLSAIFFQDSLTGFVGTNFGARIYKTTNSGNNWYLTNVQGVTNTSFPISDIFFINHTLGWATTESGAFLKTTDGGENWSALNNSIGGRTIQFFNSDTGYTLTGYLNKTSNGGINWSQIPLPEPTSGDMYFYNNALGFYSSLFGLYKTTNGGTNWNIIPNINGFGYGDFDFISSWKGYLVGPQSYYTNDSGVTWLNITGNIGGYSIAKMHSGNEFSGFAVGGHGLILNFIDTSYTPVELNLFSAYAAGQNVLLNWETATETNNKGFEIQRSEIRSQKSVWENIGYVAGFGTTTEPKSYSFTDSKVSTGIYSYRLKQIDYDGTFKYSNVVEVSINVPLKFSLGQNYPNPFNPTSQIEYSISKDGFVKLTIYNTLGQQVANIVNGFVKAGSHQVIFDGSKLSSGVYYYRIDTGDHIMVKKMMLMK